MREKKANSPLAKWLPGGSMSSTNQNPEPIISDAQIAENEMIEQLQLELEEARRTIRKHETKILSLQEGWRSFWSDYDSFRSHLLRDAKQFLFPWSLLTLFGLSRPLSMLFISPNVQYIYSSSSILKTSQESRYLFNNSRSIVFYTRDHKFW